MSLGPQIPGALVGSGVPIGPAGGDVNGTYPASLAVVDLSLSSEARGGVAVRGASAWQSLALGSVGKLLRSDGTDATWSTLTIPTTAAAGALLYATSADTLGPLALGTALQVLRVNAGATALEYAAATPLTTRGDLIRAGVAGAPERVALGATAGMFLRSDATDAVWSTLVLPNGATAGDVPVATAANTVTMLAKGASLQVLRMNVGATTQEYATLAAADVGAVPSSRTVGGYALSADVTAAQLMAAQRADLTASGWTADVGTVAGGAATVSGGVATLATGAAASSIWDDDAAALSPSVVRSIATYVGGPFEVRCRVATLTASATAYVTMLLGTGAGLAVASGSRVGFGIVAYGDGSLVVLYFSDVAGGFAWLPVVVAAGTVAAPTDGTLWLSALYDPSGVVTFRWSVGTSSAPATWKVLGSVRDPQTSVVTIAASPGASAAATMPATLMLAAGNSAAVATTATVDLVSILPVATW